MTTEELWLELGRAFRARGLRLPMQYEDRLKTDSGICYAAFYKRLYPEYEPMQRQLKAYLQRHPDFDMESGFLGCDYGRDKLARSEICFQLAREAVEKGL